MFLSSDAPYVTQNDCRLVPVSELVDVRGFKTPGGPVRAGVPSASMTSGVTESPVSPNHTHTLPNSNSAKYYTKSELLTPSDFLGSSGRDPPVSFQVDEARALLEKLNAARRDSPSTGSEAPRPVQGSSPRRQGSAPQQMSLKDIPLPPSGYQFMPPPNMIQSAPSILPVSRSKETGPDSNFSKTGPVPVSNP